MATRQPPVLKLLLSMNITPLAAMARRYASGSLDPVITVSNAA